MGTDNMMEIKGKLDRLRLLLADFRLSSFYFNNEQFYRSLIPNVEMVIALTDKGLIDKRPIAKEEEFWFGGDRFVGEAFNLRDDSVKKYHEIYKLYSEITSYAYFANYFRWA